MTFEEMATPKAGTRGAYDAGDGCLYHATVVGYVDIRCPVIVFDKPKKGAFLWDHPSEPEPFPVLPGDFTADE